MSPRAEAALAAGLVLAAGLMAVYPVSDFDVFWHLANGRWMLEHGEIATRELFSYSARGEVFDNHAWAAQMLLFLTYERFGADGLIALKAAVMMASFFALWRAARLLGAGALATALVLALAAYAMVWRMLERPELASFLFLSLSLWLYAGAKAGRGTARLWLLAPLFALWDVAHGAFFGVVLLGALAAGEFAQGLSRRRTPAGEALARPLLAVAVLVALVEAVSPWGLLRSRFFADLSGGGADFGMGVGEFLRTPFLAGFAPFWLLAALGLAAVAGALARREFAAAACLLAFLVLGVAHARAAAIYALVAAPFLARELSVAAERAGRRAWARRALPWAATAALAGFAGFTLHYKFAAPAHTNSFGLGLDRDLYPAAALRFVQDNGVAGRMFNLGHQGGYLAYFAPERPIFLYNHHQAFAAVARTLREPGLARRWAFDYAFIGARYADWRAQFPLSEWAAVYAEPAALLMLRRAPANQALIARYELLYFAPARSTEELRRLAHAPEIMPRLARELADYLAWRQDARIAALLAELATDERPLMSADFRRWLVQWARRANPDDAALRAAADSLGRTG